MPHIFRRLSQLHQASRLLEAVRCDLFPTADMIRSVSRELGKVPGSTPAKTHQVEEEVQEEPNIPSSQAVWERRRVPLDMHNAEYIEWKRLGEQAKDYVQVSQVSTVHMIVSS